eukprot:400019-Amphidinium_carterae.1
MLRQPETPTQSERGGKTKAIFSLQTERQGVSRPIHSPHEVASGSAWAPPACPGRAAGQGEEGNDGIRSSKLRPVLEPNRHVITSGHSRPVLGAPFAVQSQEGVLRKADHTKNPQHAVEQTSSEKPEGESAKNPSGLTWRVQSSC